MPYNPNKTHVEIDGKESTVAQMEKFILEEMEKQNKPIASMDKPVVGQRFGANYANMLKGKQNMLLEIVEDTMADYASTTALEYVLEEGTGKIKEVSVVADTLDLNDEGAMGYFLEEKLFGLERDSKQTADLSRWQSIGNLGQGYSVEIKAKAVIGSEMTVGGITLYGIDNLTTIEKETLLQTTLIFKMLMKMQHLLFLNMIKNFETQRMGFQAIVLYTDLYIKAIKTWLDGRKKRDKEKTAEEKALSGVINIKASYKPAYAPQNLEERVGYEIEMNLVKGNLLASLDRISQIYLMRIDIINEIKSGGVSAAEFFGKLRRRVPHGW